eukprot:SAG11_NODE_60_length_19094_cov_26.549566_11_plen_102_part_00
MDVTSAAGVRGAFVEGGPARRTKAPPCQEVRSGRVAGLRGGEGVLDVGEDAEAEKVGEVKANRDEGPVVYVAAVCDEVSLLLLQLHFRLASHGKTGAMHND